MAIRGLQVDLVLPDGTALDLTGYAFIEATTIDGRPVDSEGEAPGEAAVVLEIDDRLIARTAGRYRPADLHGAELRFSARRSDGSLAAWWTGTVAVAASSEPSLGDLVPWTIVAVDDEALLNLAGSVADLDLGIRVERRTDKDIPEQAADSRVTGLSLNDILIYGVRSDRTVTMWLRDTRELNDPPSWTLTAANASPAGIAAHADVVLCLDHAAAKAFGYATSPLIEPDTARDVAYPAPAAANPTHLDWGDGQLWIRDGNRIRSTAGDTLTLAAANDQPTGIDHDDNTADPTIRVMDRDGTLHGYRRVQSAGPSWARDATQDLAAGSPTNVARVRSGRWTGWSTFEVDFLNQIRLAGRWRDGDGNSRSTYVGSSPSYLRRRYGTAPWPRHPDAIDTGSQYPPRFVAGALVNHTSNSDSGASNSLLGRSSSSAGTTASIGDPGELDDQPPRLIGWGNQRLWSYDTYAANLGDGTTETRLVARAYQNPQWDPATASAPNSSSWQRDAAADVYTDIAHSDVNNHANAFADNSTAVGLYGARVVGDWLIVDLGSGAMRAWRLATGTRDTDADYDPAGVDDQGRARARHIAGSSIDRLHLNDAGEAWTVGSSVENRWTADATRNVTLVGYAGSGVPLDVTHGDNRWWILEAARIRVWHAAGGRDAAHDLLLTAANSDPKRIAWADGYLHVTDGDGTTYAYLADTGTAVVARDWQLGTGVAADRGLAWTGEHFLVGGTTRAAGYAGTARLTVPSPLAALDLPIDAASHTGTLSGIAMLPDGAYICDTGQPVIRWYDYDGTRQPTRDIAGPAEASWRGLTTDGVTLWAVNDTTDRAHAFLLATRRPHPTHDWPLDTLNRDPDAVVIDGGHTGYVSDQNDPIIYGYDVAPITSIQRPRETSTARYNAIARLVIDRPHPAAAWAADLPAGTVEGSITAALRATEAAEYGRSCGGFLVPRGQYRPNDNGDVLLVTTAEAGADPDRSPRNEESTAAIASSITVVAADGTRTTVGNPDVGPAKIRTVNTAADAARAHQVADWILNDSATPLPWLIVTIDAAIEADDIAAAALWTRPHTPIYAELAHGDGDTARTVWLTAERRVRLTPIGPGVLTAQIQITAVPPRRLGVGWLPGDPQRDRCGVTTIAVA